MNKVTSATTLLLGLILSLPAMAQNPNFTVTGMVKDMEGVRMIGHITDQKYGQILVTRDNQEFELKAQGWNPLNDQK